MLCTKCGKEFETPGNRCPECGSVYKVTSAFRPSEIGRFQPSNPGSELIGHQLVRNRDGKGITFLQVVGVMAAGIAIALISGFLINL